MINQSKYTFHLQRGIYQTYRGEKSVLLLGALLKQLHGIFFTVIATLNWTEQLYQQSADITHLYVPTFIVSLKSAIVTQGAA